MADKVQYCDLLVVGSGAGALAAAVTAGIQGLDVLVCEKTSHIGGATARSGGWIWIPGNPLMQGVDAAKERADARRYIEIHAEPYFDAARVDAYLDRGPEMVRFFQANSQVDFVPVTGFPDYHPKHDGAAQKGRSIMAAPFDATVLGGYRNKVNPPLPVATWAGMMVSVPEMPIFLRAGRSLPAALYVARRLVRQAWDKLTRGVTMRLANGNALVGRLLATALDRKIPIWTDAKVERLLMDEGRVVGAMVKKDGIDTTIHAKRGVVLATGGFPHDPERRASLVDWAGTRPEPWMAMPAGNTGDGLRLGEMAGGVVSSELHSPIALAPITPFREPIKGLPGFPHLNGRAKPGVLAVTRDGRRFVNEADSYHDFCLELLRATKGVDPTAWIICDSWSIRRYGLGFAKPFPLPLGPYQQSGYLTKAASVNELAAKLGIDPAGLSAQVHAFNASAARGEDPQFGRGSNAYNVVQGDREIEPNPCVAPVARAPFYAVKVVAGSLGTFAGLATDAHARVLRQDNGQPIPGLYAAGNDMLSIFGGDYISGGITLGPAMTFGYIAGMHAAEA